jgi:hypothetical protein
MSVHIKKIKLAQIKLLIKKKTNPTYTTYKKNYSYATNPNLKIYYQTDFLNSQR